MNVFLAKVRFKSEKDAENLIRSFFQNFNRESRILVKNNEAKIEISFEKPPMEIIEAISNCEIIELNYGDGENPEQKGLKSEHLEKKEKPKSENPEKAKVKSLSMEKKEKAKGKKPENEETKSKKEKPDKKKKRKPINRRLKLDKLPELEDFAKKSKSFDEFVLFVADWLSLSGNRKDYFYNLIIEATKIEKINWTLLEEKLMEKNISCKRWKRIDLSKHIWETLNDDTVHTLSFMEEVRDYQNYPFQSLQPQQDSILIEDNSKEPIKEVVRMECMPESKEFEQTLQSINKELPIEDKVRYILDSIGLKELPHEKQQKFVEIASIAIKKEDINFDEVFAEANIPDEQAMEVRMEFSKLVNDFVQKYETDKKVKLSDFLADLKKMFNR